MKASRDRSRPSHRQLHGRLCLLWRGREGRALVERHGDRRVEQMLDLDRARRRQAMRRAVQMRSERHPVGVELPKFGQRHDLEAAGIRQDRAGPVHEAMQSTEPRDAFGARPQHQVIGVAQHDAGTGGAHRVGGHRLHCAGGADRHEGGGVHVAMRGVQHARARGPIAGDDAMGECRQRPLPHRHGRAWPGHPCLCTDTGGAARVRKESRGWPGQARP